MKKTLLLTSFLIFTIIAQAQYINPKTRKVPVNPLWWEQYYTMKKNEQGVIPRVSISPLQNNLKAQYTGLLDNVQEIGPFNRGGRTRALMGDHANHNRIFAGGISGGLWISEDKGSTWNAVNDFASTLSITCITQHKKYPHIIYYGTGESAGNSAGIPGDGVFKSTDGGQTFTPLASTSGAAFDYIWSIKASPIDSHTVYVATSSSGLYRSTDGGTTFTQVYSFGSAAINDVEVLPDGTVLATVHAKGVYRSANGNPGSFVQITNGLPTTLLKRIEIAYCDSVPSTIYAAIENNNGDPYFSGLKGIWKSIDSGTTWAKVATNPDQDYGFFFSFVWYSLTLCVKPDDPNVVITGVGDLAYTSDGGASWNQAIYTHADYHSSFFDLDDPDILYIGNDGGVFQYEVQTLNNNAIDLNNGYNTQQYYAGAYFPAGITALAGAQDNGTQFCDDSNPDFEHVFGGDGSYTQVNQQFPNVAYVSYQGGTINRTDNAGSSSPSFYSIQFPEISSEGAWFINPYEVNLLDGDQLYFVTYERIWRTTDGGFNWEPAMNVISGSKKPYAIGISNSVNPTLYIGGESGLFYRIDDGKNSIPGSEVNLYTSIPTTIRTSFIGSIEVSTKEDSTIYVGLSNYSTQPRIWKVTHAKSATPVWTNISGDLPVNLPVNWVEAHPQAPDSVLIIGTDQGLYYTQNGGINWVKETAMPNVSIHQIRLRDSDRKLFVFSHGRGLWTADVAAVTVGIQPSPATAFLLNVSPNPAQEKLFVNLSEEGSYKIYIEDLQGRFIKEVHASGIFTDVSISELEKGMYIITADNGTTRQTRKFIKQ